MADSYYRANYSGDTYNRITLELHIYTVATDLVNLRTTERADLYMVVNDASSQWWNNYGSEAYVGINGNDKTATVTFDARSTGVKALISSWDTVIQHASDGSANGVGISAHHYSGVGLGNASISGSYNCDTLVVTPTFTTNPSITNKTETTVTVNRGATDISSNFYWSTNNSTWTKFTATTATITGLSPNTNYTIYIQARNSNNENYKATKQLSVTTYAMPTQTITAKTETTISVSWSISTTASHLWYSIDGGNSWQDLGGISATSGSYTITNLTANTTYNVRTLLVREENNTNVATASNSITTFSTPSISLVSKTVNSITVRWNIDETANHLWASTDNGTNWTDLGDISATSGEYTASNLQPNSFYYLKIRLRRASTSSLSVTSTLTESTYDIARITEAPELTIGQNATIKYTNPSGATIYSYIEYVMADGNGSVVVSERQITGNQYTYEFTANEIQAIYARIPNELYHRYRYVIKTIVNNEIYFHLADRNFYVDRENSKPIFSDFDFADINSDVVSLTGNNQIVVKGLSNIYVSISNNQQAIARNGATITSYRIVNGEQVAIVTPNEAYTTFNNANNPATVISAIDSRGLETTVRKVGVFKDYFVPTVTFASVSRENGIGTKALLDIRGTYWDGDFGSTQNQYHSTAIRFKKVTDSSWSAWYNIADRFSGSNGEYSTISGAFIPTTDFGTVPYEFELGAEYNIQLMIFDEAIAITHTDVDLHLDSGIPCTDKVKNSSGTYNIGINQLADSDVALAINGGLKVDNKAIQLNSKLISNIDTATETGIFVTNPNTSGTFPSNEKYGQLIVVNSNNDFNENFTMVTQIFAPTWGTIKFIRTNTNNSGWIAWQVDNKNIAFQDTSGSDWKEMLRNKLDYAKTQFTQEKESLFINGGWNGINFGYAISSRIVNEYQLTWFSTLGVYYIIQYGNGNYNYRVLSSKNYDLQDFPIGTWINR